MFSFCFNDGCVNCEPRIKRSRRSAGPPVRFAVECAEVRSAQPRAAEPLFLLERLAHIRCFTLTLCGPEGARLQGASVRVTGSVAEVLCELAPVDGVHASVPAILGQPAFDLGAREAILRESALCTEDREIIHE